MLDGEQGAVRDAVLLNAAAALAVYDAPGAPVDEALSAGLDKARGGGRLGRRPGDPGPLGRGVRASSQVQHVRRALAPEAWSSRS